MIRQKTLENWKRARELSQFSLHVNAVINAGIATRPSDLRTRTFAPSHLRTGPSYLRTDPRTFPPPDLRTVLDQFSSDQRKHVVNDGVDSHVSSINVCRARGEGEW